MVALPPLKSTTSQLLDLAKEEQTKRLLCEGGEVGTKGSHIDHRTLRLSEGRDGSLLTGYAERSRVSKPHADNLFGGFKCNRLRGRWEWYRRPHRGSHKTGGERGTWMGCCVGTGHKRDSDRKGQRGALKKNGRPTDSTGTAREVFRPAHGNRTGTETV